MAYDADLPTLETQIAESSLEPTETDITEVGEFGLTFVQLEDPPKVEVSRGHIVEAVNGRELNSLLIDFDTGNDTMYAFYVHDDGIESYEATYEDGVMFLTQALLAENWVVLTFKEDIKTRIPDGLEQFLDEMTIVNKTVLDEGELFTRLYGMNQLKRRIVSIKDSESDGLFNPAVETEYPDEAV